MKSAAELIMACERHHLLAAAQMDELRPQLRSFVDAKTLARHLIERGWITPYQANQLLTGKANDLLLGSYVLLERIGEGGMGAVFKARNWKLDRLCAVKVIRKERLTSTDAVKRFAREIEAASKLDHHAHVVHTQDAGESNSTHFFVMDYVPGVNLSKLVKDNGPLSPMLACEYIRQAALGLQHAHEQGLVHRDVKPGNLLLDRSKSAGTIKLLDLGLARMETQDDVTGLTNTGDLVGTLDYMAPEQAKVAKNADARSDLYSLGCTFYYLLAGRAPFAGFSNAEKLLKHQLEHPRAIEEVRSDVPRAIIDVVNKLLAKRPEDRFRSAAEVAERLRGMLADASTWSSVSGPVKPASDSSSETAPLARAALSSLPSDATVSLPSDRKPAERLPIVALAGSVVGLVILGLIVINLSGVFSNPPPAPPPPVQKDETITISGELQREDPPDPFRRQMFKVESPHRVHDVKLTAGKSYQIDLRSNYFDTFLRVENANGVCLAIDDDSGENRSSKLTFVATESTPYKIVASSVQLSGSYTITITPAPAVFAKNGLLAHAEQTFVVPLVPGKRYAIDLISNDFDAFLRIEDPRGEAVDEADSGGVDKNARIFIEPAQAGQYKFVATSPRGDGRGRFIFSVVEAGRAPIPIAFTGNSVQGQLAPSDLPDKMRNQPCKVYTYPMQTGKMYQIDLESIAFDPYLRLESPNGAHLAANDDHGGSLWSQISFTPPRDGLYRIVATSYLTAGTGYFTLRVAAVTSKTLLDSNGTLGKKEMPHRITMAAGNKYVIETLSKKADTVVVLKNSSGVQVGRDDDSGGDRNARLAYECTLSGEYQIFVSGYSEIDRGNYRLLVREISTERKK